jgi:hypothetical protein
VAAVSYKLTCICDCDFVHLRHMCGGDDDRVLHVLELHLDAHLCCELRASCDAIIDTETAVRCRGHCAGSDACELPLVS